MEIDLIRIGIEEAKKLWKMQVKAFEDLYKNIKIPKRVRPQKELKRLLCAWNNHLHITILLS